MSTKAINYIDPKIREIKEWIKLRDNRICLMIVIVLFAAVAVLSLIHI